MAEQAPKDKPTPVLATGLAAFAVIAAVACASAVEARADSAAPDSAAAERLSRKVAASEGRLALPLPGTPDTATLPSRIAAAGLKLGSPLLIRIFKAESELEIWMEKDGTYVPFATYPICYWSGTLGPKLREGDRQAPEGFYTITIHQLHDGRRWQRSLDVGFPNAFDEANARDGSNILVHGGCNSVGCFAMTDPVNAEIYELVSAALSAGVVYVPVHVFPFRMTEENLAAHATDKWINFWGTLKQGYDVFERTGLPPRISVCEKSYAIERPAADAGIEAGPVALCERAPGATPDGATSEVVAQIPAVLSQPSAETDGAAGAIPAILLSTSAVRVVAAPKEKEAAPAEIASKPAVASAAPKPKKRVGARGCSASRPSCRHWTALRTNRTMLGRITYQRADANVRVRKHARLR